MDKRQIERRAKKVKDRKKSGKLKKLNMKQKIAITAAVVVIAGCITFFAMQNRIYFSGNEFGWKLLGMVSPGVRLHDDQPAFDGETKHRTVYVENTGDTPLYVRMKLYEYMEFGKRSIVDGAKRDDKGTWSVHIPFGMDCKECEHDFHMYFSLSMGNEEPIEYQSGVRDRYVAGSKFEEGAKDNLFTPTATVITMADYTALDTKPHNCWIIDTDGYAYWSEKLEGNSATGALLSGLKNEGNIEDTYYYNIFVVLETVMDSNLDSWIKGKRTIGSSIPSGKASKSAVKLLKQIEKEK